jgi:anti-sigma factor RsiW
MSECAPIQNLASLAAAGALDAEEERRVRSHVSACPSCAAELEELSSLTSELRRLATPMAPSGLTERVRRLVHLELASRSDEKLNRIVLVFLLLFSWTVTVVGFVGFRLLTGAGADLFGFLTASDLPLSVAYFGTAWLGGAAALVLVGLQYRRDRRSSGAKGMT